ncbi:DUF1294 domain-containing protein [Litchfieldia salsa]|uniref:Uncharacterized membrane protein YsdA, DUF1294 family n=1 Tax=Litchfieldia salsa TaxID=930152 RepID=A0A1H0NZX3_9BACI|nr:Uncharacterized membrane protein YsdA, DUF1294 family [Litchfieldia salsa]
MNNWVLVMIYILINFYGYTVMYSDKKKAKRNEWRISERQIWLTAILGGALGLTIGMFRFRHKTKHMSFRVFLPVLATVTAAGYMYILISLIK